jgi:large subunit ribosomal protein L29
MRIKASELRGLTLEDLIAKVKVLNEELFKIRIQKATGTVNNKHAIVSKRRELAKVKTVLNEKLGGAQ